MPTAIIPRQTNTALYVQLHDAGYTTDDLLAVSNAYRLSALLFNGRYRKTERAFLCHAVGAASSVAHFDQRLTMVLTAMLHAVYDSGQFPDGRTGKATPGHRKWLASQVGAEVETMLFRYSTFDFESGSPERCAREGCDFEDRDLLLIALAHELDDLADCGLAFAPKYGQSIESRVEACVELAERIEQPKLAEALRACGRTYKDMQWAEPLQRAELSGYRIAPSLKAYCRLRHAHRRSKGVVVQ